MAVTRLSLAGGFSSDISSLEPTSVPLPSLAMHGGSCSTLQGPKSRFTSSHTFTLAHQSSRNLGARCLQMI